MISHATLAAATKVAQQAQRSSMLSVLGGAPASDQRDSKAPTSATEAPVMTVAPTSFGSECTAAPKDVCDFGGKDG